MNKKTHTVSTGIKQDPVYVTHDIELGAQKWQLWSAIHIHRFYIHRFNQVWTKNIWKKILSESNMYRYNFSCHYSLNNIRTTYIAFILGITSNVLMS